MRILSSSLFVLTALVTTACGGGEASSLEGPARAGDPAPSPEAISRGGAGGGEALPTGGAVAPASTGPACPDGLVAPKSLGPDLDTADVRIVDDTVYYRALTKVMKVGRDGAGRAEVFTSSSLVRSFVDSTSLLAIESPNPPDAVLRVRDVATPGEGTALPTNLNAASTFVFASDATGFYLVSDGTNGDTIYHLDRTKLELKPIAQVDGVVSDPQLSGTTVWYVRDAKRVYKIEQTTDGVASPPAEVFGLGYAACNLAVGERAAFCSTGSAIEQRELSGANPRTLLEATKSTKAVSPFGPAMLTGAETLLVRSTSTDALKTIVRSIKPTAAGADETLVACGRGAVTSMHADAKSVVFAESGKGVFIVPR